MKMKPISTSKYSKDYFIFRAKGSEKEHFLKRALVMLLRKCIELTDFYLKFLPEYTVRVMLDCF